nr:BspA family leucine-rich repeat surface protein [Spirochaetales bacterium]
YGMFYGASVANPNISNWNVSAVTSMDGMFNGTAFSNTNYDLLLSAWSLLTLQTLVPFHAGLAKYTKAAERSVLTSAPNSWTITDGGAL